MMTRVAYIQLRSCVFQLRNGRKTSVSERASSVELIHAAEQLTEFSGDVEGFLACGRAIRQLRFMPR